MADTAAPELTGFELPDTVDVGSGETTTSFFASASDNTDVDDVTIYFDRDISTSLGNYNFVSVSDWYSGDLEAGINEQRTILPGTATDDITIDRVRVEDVHGNRRTYSEQDLVDAGYDTSFTITGGEAATDPESPGSPEPSADIRVEASFSGGNFSIDFLNADNRLGPVTLGGTVSLGATEGRPSFNLPGSGTANSSSSLTETRGQVSFDAQSLSENKNGDTIFSLVFDGSTGIDIPGFDSLAHTGPVSAELLDTDITVDGITMSVTMPDVLHGGTAGDDVMRGTAGADFIVAAGGSDTVWAGPEDRGDDEVDGRSGNDTLGLGAGDDIGYGRRGEDTLFGGEGDDLLKSNRGADMIWAGTGADTLQGQEGDDLLGGGFGSDVVLGGVGQDILYGGADESTDSLNGGGGDDIVFAGRGDDDLSGAAGADTLYNGGGCDVVDGGEGDDLLWGGGGNDTLTGDAGNDVFAFVRGNGTETIKDFDVQEDMIRIENGPNSFGGLSFSMDGSSVEISFAEVAITLEGVTRSELDANFFMFT